MMGGGGFGGPGGMLQSQFGQGPLLNGPGGFNRPQGLAQLQPQLPAQGTQQPQQQGQQAQGQQSQQQQQSAQQPILGLGGIGAGMKRSGMPGMGNNALGMIAGANTGSVVGGPLNFASKSGQPNVVGGPSPLGLMNNGLGQNAVGPGGAPAGLLGSVGPSPTQQTAGVVGGPAQNNNATGNVGLGGATSNNASAIGGGLLGAGVSNAGTPGANPTSTPAAIAAALSGIQQEDKFGLLGLIDVIRMTDPDMNMLALGCDLAGLGLNLNSVDPLYSTFMSVFSATPTETTDPVYNLPPCYTLPKINQPPSALNKINSYTDETLFYAFYAMPRETIAEAAAQELYNRSWRYHKEMKLWLCRDTTASTSTGGADGSSSATDGTPPPGTANGGASAAAVSATTSAPNYVKGNGYERGVFVFFDPGSWQKIKKEWVVYYEMLEERRVSGGTGSEESANGESGGDNDAASSLSTAEGETSSTSNTEGATMNRTSVNGTAAGR
jgi:CCR4-NOT transcription complex subunit 2